MRLLLLIAALIVTTPLTAQDAVEAKNWLITTIEEHFSQFPSQPIEQIATERYAEYRQDAICVDYDCDTPLTLAQFEQKWGDIYDISYAGIGESFLIGQQDNGKIVMSKCELTAEPVQLTYVFDTVVEDTMFKLTYSIEIWVKKTSSGFRIDDVKRRKQRE